VLVRNLTILKGSANCTEALIGGFRSSAACGVDPPAAGTAGTYFLCQAEDAGGLCKGVLNTNGNIHLGFETGAVSDPGYDCSAGSTCTDVALCSIGNTGASTHAAQWTLVLALSRIFFWLSSQNDLF
ncbi:UPF0586 protein, partial [Durusdinium trenchii]